MRVPQTGPLTLNQTDAANRVIFDSLRSRPLLLDPHLHALVLDGVYTGFEHGEDEGVSPAAVTVGRGHRETPAVAERAEAGVGAWQGFRRNLLRWNRGGECGPPSLSLEGTS